MIDKPIKQYPIFCPNPKCTLNDLKNPRLSNQEWLRRHGSYPTKGGPLRRSRFRCKSCLKTFSETVHSLDFRNQKLGIHSPIFERFIDGATNHQIARRLFVSEYLVRSRLQILAKQSLLQTSIRAQSVRVNELVAYDGVENFARSQYEPNNINQAIGHASQYIYDFSFSPLNRRGRVSPRQKLQKEKLEKSLGRFPREAIRYSTVELFRRLDRLRNPDAPLVVGTDMHYLYCKAIEIDLPKLGIRIHHKTISSKAYRCYRHILFPVNHVDNLLRHHVKAFTRETIAFSKRHFAMVQKYALFAGWKNFLRPQFTKVQKFNPLSNKQSPAMAVGIENRILSFEEYFGSRLQLGQACLSEEWTMFFNNQVPYARAK